jgi:hypothetical protein
LSTGLGTHVQHIITCKECGRRAAMPRPRFSYCDECRSKVRSAVKARSDKKNAERVRETGKRWRHENPERSREHERRRAATPERKAYQRAAYQRRRAERIAPRLAAAAAEVDRGWLALPPGPTVEERIGPTCAVACVPQRKFVVGFCLECGECFTACQDRGDRFCSILCGKRYDRGQRRARKIAAFVEPVYRRRVFERDGWRCQLCKRLVSKTAVVPHPRAATIDHIVPLAEHGEHSMANAQTAHFMCNSQKGAQARNEQLRLVG